MSRRGIGALGPAWVLAWALGTAGGTQAMEPQDWADLGHYRAQNEALRSSGSPDPQRVVLLGDSITEGWPARPGLWDAHFVNRGISGQTTPQMLLRLRPDVIALAPGALVVLAGTNDIAGNTGPATDEEIEGNLASIAELGRVHGMRVLLCSILPTRAYPWNPGARPAPRVLAINRWMREFAAGKGFEYVDYHSAMAEPDGGLRRDLGDDGVHPNERGYAIMARLLREALWKEPAAR